MFSLPVRTTIGIENFDKAENILIDFKDNIYISGKINSEISFFESILNCSS